MADSKKCAHPSCNCQAKEGSEDWRLSLDIIA